MTIITAPPHAPEHTLAHRAFHRNYRSPRTLLSVLLSVLAAVLTVLACVPLFSVLLMLIWRGGKRLVAGGLSVFTQLPPGAADPFGTGGFGSAMVGTVLMVTLAALLAVPFGILAALFLAEYGPRSRLATFVRFAAKVMTGLPSILAGVFAYVAVVLFTKGYLDIRYSAIAGGVALAVLMLPIVLLTAEDAIKMVPAKMREAAIGMGATQAQVTWKVILPTALPGILTGVMLAVARAAGETAPLLFTALYASQLWPIDGSTPFIHAGEPTASMAVFIYNNSKAFTTNLIELAWAASLVLVVMVLIFNIGGQLLSRRGRPTR